MDEVMRTPWRWLVLAAMFSATSLTAAPTRAAAVSVVPVQKGATSSVLPTQGATSSAAIAAQKRAATAAEPFSSGRLFRISKRGTADSYVLGTIHVADPRVSVIQKPVADALARSRSMLMELLPQATTESFEPEQLDGGRTLEELVGRDTYVAVRRELLLQGMAEPAIRTLKPWAALIRIGRSDDAAGRATLDEALYSAARARGLHPGALEWLDEQIASFDSIPMWAQVALLDDTLAHRDVLAADTEPTIEAWLQGDLSLIARIARREGERYPRVRAAYAELERHIIRDRTVLMHFRMFMPLRSGGVFVALGALHLHGRHGLLAMLAQDGYRLTRVW